MIMRISTICSSCRKGRLISDPESGEIICSSCGQVFSDKVVETRPEWRDFGAETIDRIRVGAATSLARHDMGLATVIGRTNKDASGAIIDPLMRFKIGRMRTWDRRIMAHSYAERNLMKAFQELDRLKDKLGLSDAIVEKTAYIYRKTQEKGLVMGRSIFSIVGACTYLSCRELAVPITLKDIALAGDLDERSLSRNYRIIVKKLDIKVPNADPVKCIVKIANKVELDERTKREAIQIMKELAKTGMHEGKDPMGIAAAIVFQLCSQSHANISQRIVAQAAGVTEATIRNRSKDLRHFVHLIG
jgi:transcription initiation factor TFIIB